MSRMPEPANPWGFLCTFPGWRGLRETLQELEQSLRTVGGDAADLGATVSAVLADPASVRANLPDSYRLRVDLKRARLPEHLDLETELPGWLTEVACYACDVPVLLQAAATADGLGPALTSDLPRALQVRFADLVHRLRQAIQNRKLRAGAAPSPPAPSELWGDDLRFAVTQPDGYALVLPQGASADLWQAAWRELAWLLLAHEGADVARLHLALLAAWPAELSRDQVCAALGLHRSKAERCYAAIRRLQRLRLSLYLWAGDPAALALEHQARDLWALRLREGGQAHLVEEGGNLVTRGERWSITPEPYSFAATLRPRHSIRPGLACCWRLLADLDGSRNPLSLALGLTLARGRTSLTNRELLRLAGLNPAEPQPGLWSRVRAAIRLQQKAGWQADFSRWGKRNEVDWEQFLATETSFVRTEPEAPGNEPAACR